MADAEVIEYKTKKVEKVKAEVKPPKNYVIPKIGLRNRVQYPIHVVMKDCDTLLQPGQVTNKIYLESDIVTVEKLALRNAVSKGLITIVR